MPVKAPRLCPCGFAIPPGVRCDCEAKGDAARKARFDLKRPTSSQRGYTGEWDREKAVFLRKHRFCIRCGAPATTVDHRVAHKGDRDLFWDRTNWDPFCGPCHNSAKQREERRASRS